MEIYLASGGVLYYLISASIGINNITEFVNKLCWAAHDLCSVKGTVL